MTIDYQLLIDEAMLGIVRKILINTQNNGLDADQCFYISFRTDYPEVVLSKHVKNRYPKEITIILQYQYRDLQVFEDRFSVNIAFSGIPETIQVPFAALTGFVDPSVNFSLQFKHPLENNKPLINDDKDKPKTTKQKSQKDTGGVVIALDQFRKK